PDNPLGQSQKYMMYIMPVFALSGLYWQFGLVLYWVTTNVWTLGQQYVLFRKYPQPAAAAAAAGPASTPGPTGPAATPPRRRPPARADRGGDWGEGAGRKGGGRRSSDGAQPRGAGRRTTGSAAARPAPRGAAAPANGGGMLRRLGRNRAEPEPPSAPEVKIVRQQRQRQARSKRAGKRGGHPPGPHPGCQQRRAWRDSEPGGRRGHRAAGDRGSGVPGRAGARGGSRSGG